jgi:S1-C subfamily serine protease
MPNLTVRRFILIFVGDVILNIRCRSTFFKLLPTVVLLFLLPVCIVCTYGAEAAPSKLVPMTTVQIAARALRSVVSIVVSDSSGQAVKSGSGFIIAPGLIATNQHVVSGAQSVSINFSDGSSVRCPGFVFELTRYDLAVITCNTGSRKPLDLADSSSVAVGENVVALGSPEGFAGTVSTGIISQVRISADHGNAKLLQTTAPISHGSSGGPSLDQFGRVIGMTSLNFVGGQNLNFAYASGYITSSYDAWLAKNSGQVDPILQLIKTTGLPVSYGSLVTAWDAVPLLADASVKLAPALIESLRDQGADVNAPDVKGEHAIDYAIRQDSLDSVEALIDAGADVNFKDAVGNTPVMYCHSPGIIKALVGAGADVNARDSLGITAVDTAATVGLLDCLKALIAAGANVNIGSSRRGVTPVMDTVEYDQPECLAALISAGADVDASDVSGQTALMIASLLDKRKMLQELIEAGANVNAADQFGNTALSSGSSYPDIVAALHAAGETQ